MRDVLRPGQKSGLWTVLGFDKSIKEGRPRYSSRHFWLCQCECGTVKSVEEHNLKSGRSVSCGCYQKKAASERSFMDLTGQRFGRWLVIRRAEDGVSRGGNRFVRFTCRCDCGQVREVAARNLVSGDSQSCGCAHYELLKKRVGLDSPSYKHGKSKTAEYRRRPKWWSTYIRKRDKVCIACQDIPEVGHAHHLDAWQLFPEKREDESNGALLCDACHYEFHRLFGKKTTKKQFFEWLQSYYPDAYLALVEGYGYEEETIDVLGYGYLSG